jgi:uncharacterized Zn-binding protein involved in type VI secretion
MPGIVRKGDSHAGHASPTPSPFHKTAYASGSSNVKVNSKDVIREGDSTACGDPAVGKSSNVKVNSIGVHRLGDSTGGHGSWVANSAATSSTNVFANGGGGSQGTPATAADAIASKGSCTYFDWNNNTCLDQSSDANADYYVSP